MTEREASFGSRASFTPCDKHLEVKILHRWGILGKKTPQPITPVGTENLRNPTQKQSTDLLRLIVCKHSWKAASGGKSSFVWCMQSLESLLMSDEGSPDSCRLLKRAGLPEGQASNTRLTLTMRSGAPVLLLRRPFREDSWQVRTHLPPLHRPDDDGQAVSNEVCADARRCVQERAALCFTHTSRQLYRPSG